MNDRQSTGKQQVWGETVSDGRPTRNDGRCRCREHFIPLRNSELIRLLAEDERFSHEARGQFLQLCKLMSATIHYEYHERLEELKELYAPFNPDSVTKELQNCNDVERESLVSDLFEKAVSLLQRANYRRLSRADIEQAMGAASDWGVRLEVDLNIFDRLEVYARGDASDFRRRRSWRSYYRFEEIELPLYRRLVVVFRARAKNQFQRHINSKAVYLKIFKDIPKQDLDMLLPAARFRMTMMDRGRILLPTLSGIAIAVVKIVKGALLLAFAGVYGLLAVLGFVGGTLGYGVKSFMSYLKTKEKYQLHLTRNLYYQNLDNNLGVFHRLIDEAEEQEFGEAILAYALLRWESGADGWTQHRLDHEAERYLSEKAGLDVDFEVHDALEKLARFGCAVKCSGGRWRAATLSEALAHLDRAWDAFFHHR